MFTARLLPYLDQSKRCLMLYCVHCAFVWLKNPQYFKKILKIDFQIQFNFNLKGPQPLLDKNTFILLKQGRAQDQRRGREVVELLQDVFSLGVFKVAMMVNCCEGCKTTMRFMCIFPFSIVFVVTPNAKISE